MSVFRGDLCVRAWGPGALLVCVIALGAPGVLQAQEAAPDTEVVLDTEPSTQPGDAVVSNAGEEAGAPEAPAADAPALDETAESEIPAMEGAPAAAESLQVDAASDDTVRPAGTVLEEAALEEESGDVPVDGDGSQNEIGGEAADPLETAVGLPRDLSVWGMFRDSDWVVKAVMIGLVFASILTWTVLLAKTLELGGVRRRLAHSLGALRNARSLADVTSLDAGIGQDLVAAALAEWRSSSDAPDKDGIKERVASSLTRTEAGAARRLTVGTGVLATIGATAPFVGLFGTVWGIMNAFIGISEAQTTNLAVVAPGIAEALLATALGLIAAIPAVVIYNHFARSIGGIKALIADQSAAVLRLVSRDLDRDLVPSGDLRAAE